MRRLPRRFRYAAVLIVLLVGVGLVGYWQATLSGRDSAGGADGGHVHTSSYQMMIQPAPGDVAASLTGSPSTGPSTGASTAAGGTGPASPKPVKTTPPASSQVVNELLAQINQLRADNGLPPYPLSSGLNASAHKHNLLMAGGCGMSHQCPGEPGLGDRISAQGVKWTSCGENVGWSGPHPNTTAAIVAAAEGLTTAMYNEKPPDDGHRRNLLSTSFHHVGIDVIRDSSGKVWLTQDFSS